MVEPNSFSSFTNSDCSKLQELLQAGKWEEADNETLAIMLRATNREQEGWLDIEHIQQFPNSGLNTINQLWLNYSNGHFGFSVQKSLWGQGPDLTINFFWWVGWLEQRSWGNGAQGEYRLKASFEITAPKGHLPRLVLINYLKRTGFAGLSSVWGHGMWGSKRTEAYKSMLDECDNCRKDLNCILGRQYL
ncbi:MAG TPA: hypothetical protein DCP31_39835, partial [Cyanobacteria bacterium UBA8543]|nr:hypothetical protein [Cyanobacteria bacterium UBA8543]